jgi:PhzF family phenazine biosynthesis protein
MRSPIFQVDAFTDRLFGGNPAAVMPMARFPDDAVMQAIAAENNLAETAFLVPSGGDYLLRWFTPAVEVPLCGHATLASAAVVMERLEPERTEIVFHTASGRLKVKREAGTYVIDLPARAASPAAAPAGLVEALGAAPSQVLVNEFNYMAVLASAGAVRSLTPDLALVARLDRSGLIVTAPGDEGYDFVSRYFAPAKGISEDPVTGAAHCMLVPYWASRIGKAAFRAHQASPRGGEIACRLVGDRVELSGSCIFYLEGSVTL